MLDLRNCDCMDLMREFPDKHFDLAIVDPPYGLGKRLSDGGGKLKNRPFCTQYRESTQWDDAPDPEYFEELFRVSQNQIIWGGNYFGLPASRCMICWDKEQPMPTLSAWELGWTSFDKPSKIFKASSTDLARFHPTQKPVALYRWLLHNYAKPGDKILDTHLGSGSIAIACHEKGFDLTGSELDPDYFAAMQKRLENAMAQQVLL